MALGFPFAVWMMPQMGVLCDGLLSSPAHPPTGINIIIIVLAKLLQ